MSMHRHGGSISAYVRERKKNRSNVMEAKERNQARKDARGQFSLSSSIHLT